MAAPFLGPLPALQYPQNALLNFAPINDAIDTSIANNRFQQQFGLQQQAQQNQVDQFGQNLDLSKQRLAQEGSQFQQNFGLQKQQTESQVRAAQDQHDQMMWQHIGSMAEMARNEPDPQKRAAMYQNIVTSDPEYQSMKSQGKLPAGLLDPETGLQMLVAKAGLYKQPTFGTVDESERDLQGQPIKRSGWIDPNNRTTTYGSPTGGSAAAGGTTGGPPTASKFAADTSGLTGQELADQLRKNGVPEGDVNTIVGFGKGLGAPVPLGSRNMHSQWLWSQAQQMYPGLDSSNFATRQAMNKYMGSGEGGNNMKKINTLADHASDATDKIDDLNNSNVFLGNAGRTIIQPLQGERSGVATKQDAYRNAMGAVAGELSGALGSTAVTEVEGWKNSLANPNASKQQQYQSVASALSLALSRRRELEGQASRVIGQPDKPYVEPENLATYQYTLKRAIENGASVSPDIMQMVGIDPRNPTAPLRMTDDAFGHALYSKLKSGEQYVAPDGSLKVKQ